MGRSATKHIGPWTLLVLLSLAFVLNYTDRQVVFAIFPVLRREMFFSDVQLGLAGSLFTWTYSISMPLSGRIADFVPRHRLVIAALVLWSIATLGTGLSHSIGQFLSFRVLMGVTESLYVPAAVAMISKAHSHGTRSRALSIHGLAQFTGITFGGWYGGWAADHIGWRTGFSSLALAGVLYSLFLTWRFHRLESDDQQTQTSPTTPAEVLRSRSYLALCSAFSSFCAMLWILYSWLPTYIYDKFHLSLAGSGLTATLYLQCSSALGALIGGFVGDFSADRYRNGRFRVVAVALFLCAPFAAGIYGAESLKVLELSACCFGIFAGFFMANVFASAHDIVSQPNFGFATGLLNMAGGLGAGAAVFITGLLKHSLGMSNLMFAATVAAMLTAILLALTVKKTRIRPKGTLVPAMPTTDAP